MARPRYDRRRIPLHPVPDAGKTPDPVPNLLVCSVMPSVTRPYYHIRYRPPGGRYAKGLTLCGLPAEWDYHFGARAWGQPELGTWCDECRLRAQDAHPTWWKEAGT